MRNYYPERSEGGKIVNLFRRPQFGGHEKLPEDNQEVIDYNNTPTPEPTNEELYDHTMKNGKLIKVLALSINDGSFIPGGNISGSALRTLIIDKMNLINGG